MKASIHITLLTCLLWVAVPAATQTVDPLLEAAFAGAAPVYAESISYERLLLDSDGAIAGQYVLGWEARDGHVLPALEMVTEPDGSVPHGVQAVAAAYRPELVGILAGVANDSFVIIRESHDAVTYRTRDGEAKALGLNVSLTVSTASGLITQVTIGDPHPAAIDVRYTYDPATYHVVQVETTFSSGDDLVNRWTLIDTLVDVAPALPARIDAEATATAEVAAAPKGHDAPASAPIEFASTADLLPPIGLGNPSCNAPGGICLDLGVSEFCTNVALGVVMRTNTNFTMNGVARFDYPLDGEPGMAAFTATGDAGNVTVDYRFQYGADLCVRVAPLIGPTCTLSAGLGMGNVSGDPGMGSFTPFLLPGDAQTSAGVQDSLGTFTAGVTPGISICGLELGLSGGLDINPNVDFVVSGETIEAAAGGLGKGTSAGLVPAVEGENTYVVTWRGTTNATGAVNMTPRIAITIPLVGQINLLSLGTIPLNLPGDEEDVTLTDNVTVELQTPRFGRGCASSANSAQAAGIADACLLFIATVVLLLRRRVRRV